MERQALSYCGTQSQNWKQNESWNMASSFYPSRIPDQSISRVCRDKHWKTSFPALNGDSRELSRLKQWETRGFPPPQRKTVTMFRKLQSEPLEKKSYITGYVKDISSTLTIRSPKRENRIETTTLLHRCLKKDTNSPDHFPEPFLKEIKTMKQNGVNS